jgi:hypothetical protein
VSTSLRVSLFAHRNIHLGSVGTCMESSKAMIACASATNSVTKSHAAYETVEMCVRQLERCMEADTGFGRIACRT